MSTSLENLENEKMGCPPALNNGKVGSALLSD